MINTSMWRDSILNERTIVEIVDYQDGALMPREAMGVAVGRLAEEVRFLKSLSKLAEG